MPSDHSAFSQHRAWAAPPLIRGDWRDLELGEAASLLVRFVLLCGHPSAKTLFIQHWPTRVRAMRPTFYPGWVLAEVQAALSDGSIGLCDFLYGPLGCLLIDGTSPPIHWLNAQGALHIEDDAPAASDYLRFFCSAVHGEAGRFQIVESLETLPAAGDGGAPPIDSETEKSIRPVDIRAEGSGYVSTASVLYGADLFRAEFSIATSGMIQMNDDTPLGALPVQPEEFRSPFRIVRDARGSAPRHEPRGGGE